MLLGKSGNKCLVKKIYKIVCETNYYLVITLDLEIKKSDTWIAIK